MWLTPISGCGGRSSSKCTRVAIFALVRIDVRVSRLLRDGAAGLARPCGLLQYSRATSLKVFRGHRCPHKNAVVVLVAGKSDFAAQRPDAGKVKNDRGGTSLDSKIHIG